MMDMIQQYDHVVLKDGREGTVVDIFGDQEEFLVDIQISPTNWDTVLVTREDIE